MTSRPAPWRHLRRVALVLVVLSVLVAGSTTLLRSRSAVTDEPTYDSLEDLARAADAVVVGNVTGTVDHFVDRGDDPAVDEAGETIPGIPMVAFEIDGIESIAGDVPTRMRIVMADSEKVNISNRSPLREGERVLLFLRRRTNDEAPGVKAVADVVWVPLSGDRAVFDVVGDMTRPRSDSPMVAAGESIIAPEGLPLTTVIDIVSQVP